MAMAMAMAGEMAMERRWTEALLVGLGFILHALYMLSIFDIYFKTPIVHGMDPVEPRTHAPAKRLVLFIGTPSLPLPFVPYLVV
jgi:phosphatidylinositol glycan class N